MTINRINFKSSLLTQMEQKTNIPVTNQPINTQSKPRTNTTTMIIGGSTVLLLTIALLKRKSITNFFKKLINKIPKDAQTTIQETTSNIEKQLAEKLKIIPKPNFTCTPESDPDKYFKERRNYASSLKKYTRYEDEDIAYKAIELIGKYGCTERHIESIAGFAGTNEKKPRLIRTFVTAVADMGFAMHSGLIANFLERTRAQKNINLYDNETLKTIINGLDRIGNVEEIEILKKYLNHDNAEIRELAQKAIESIKERGTYRGFPMRK